jgi:hypothetical protein
MKKQYVQDKEEYEANRPADVAADDTENEDKPTKRRRKKGASGYNIFVKEHRLEAKGMYIDY